MNEQLVITLYLIKVILHHSDTVQTIYISETGYTLMGSMRSSLQDP